MNNVRFWDIRIRKILILVRQRSGDWSRAGVLTCMGAGVMKLSRLGVGSGTGDCITVAGVALGTWVAMATSSNCTVPMLPHWITQAAEGAWVSVGTIVPAVADAGEVTVAWTFSESWADSMLIDVVIWMGATLLVGAGVDAMPVASPLSDAREITGKFAWWALIGIVRLVLWCLGLEVAIAVESNKVPC